MSLARYCAALSAASSWSVAVTGSPPCTRSLRAGLARVGRDAAGRDLGALDGSDGHAQVTDQRGREQPPLGLAAHPGELAHGFAFGEARQVLAPLGARVPDGH